MILSCNRYTQKIGGTTNRVNSDMTFLQYGFRWLYLSFRSYINLAYIKIYRAWSENFKKPGFSVN